MAMSLPDLFSQLNGYDNIVESSLRVGGRGVVANLLVYFSIKLSREREREVTQKIDGKFL